MNEILRESTQRLEDSFFPIHNERLQNSLHGLRLLEVTDGMLHEISGIVDSDLMQKLSSLKIRPSVFTATILFPVVWAAWGDGTVHAKETKALLSKLEKTFFFHTIARDVIEAWLVERPSEPLFADWAAFVGKLCTLLEKSERKRLKDEIIKNAAAVAKSAGGFLSLGSLSAKEQAILEAIERAFVG